MRNLGALRQTIQLLLVRMKSDGRQDDLSAALIMLETQCGWTREQTLPARALLRSPRKSGRSTSSEKWTDNKTCGPEREPLEVRGGREAAYSDRTSDFYSATDRGVMALKSATRNMSEEKCWKTLREACGTGSGRKKLSRRDEAYGLSGSLTAHFRS